MAKMLDGPVPEGARSVSWPWYHHTLTTELTIDAREVLEKYSKVSPEDVEKHVYRIVSHVPGPFAYCFADTALEEGQSMGDLPLALCR